MEEAKYTDFGIAVKAELLKNGKTLKWLQETVSEKTGLFCDYGYLYKIFVGKRTPRKIVDAICETLDLKQ